MSSIRWQPNDPNIYLYVEGRWYRYLSTSAPVGEGAMGIVYLGFDCMTNEKVAIKMLRQEFWHDQQIRNRLRLEASISISHPNIIRMLGYCEDSSMTGPLYVLSEYIYGVTFKEHVEQLSNFELNREDQFNKIVTEFLPAMDAVDHLHSLGVIHRDIKPANLMFQDGNTLKLMDLGIAKADYFFTINLNFFEISVYIPNINLTVCQLMHFFRKIQHIDYFELDLNIIVRMIYSVYIIYILIPSIDIIKLMIFFKLLFYFGGVCASLIELLIEF